MKVFHQDSNEDLLSKKEKEKLSVLKLAGQGEYVKGIGIRDKEFYLLVEDEPDDMYLAYMTDPVKYNDGLGFVKDFRDKFAEIEMIKSKLRGLIHEIPS
jgi:hypothetical protein